MWRTKAVKSAPSVSTPTLIRPMHAGVPVMVRVPGGFALRSAPVVDPVVPAVVPPTQAQDMLDLDFDVSTLGKKHG